MHIHKRPSPLPPMLGTVKEFTVPNPTLFEDRGRYIFMHVCLDFSHCSKIKKNIFSRKKSRHAKFQRILSDFKSRDGI